MQITPLSAANSAFPTDEDRCYLCARTPANYPLDISDTFTDHYRARAPESDRTCARCQWALKLRCWYFNPNKQQWVILFGRVWSWLISEKESYPTIGDPVTHNFKGKDLTFPLVTSLPTRKQMREWLINPPEPPFEIVIAESGQKHILPFSESAMNRDYFRVIFESFEMYIDRPLFVKTITAFEDLMRLGFSKTEIVTGKYQKIVKDEILFRELNQIIATHRKTSWFKLVNHVAGIEREELTEGAP